MTTYLLLIQIVSNVTQILSIVFKTEADWYMQLYFVVCSFIIPIVVLNPMKNNNNNNNIENEIIKNINSGFLND